jgi:23S rRNA (guanosine2251-2'-O)-methyltransferase
LKKQAQNHQIPIKFVPKKKLELLADNGAHQGFVLAVTPFRYFSLEELINKTEEENPFFIILDGIQDPHNLGSILRTADAAKVSGVIIPKHRSVGITSTVVKTSTGAAEYVPIARVTNLNAAVKALKAHGFWVFGTAMDGINYTKWNTQGKIVLIIGNEGRGISPALQKNVDETIAIPMQGHVQSLNASVASALLIYEVFRHRAD